MAQLSLHVLFVLSMVSSQLMYKVYKSSIGQVFMLYVQLVYKAFWNVCLAGSAFFIILRPDAPPTVPMEDYARQARPPPRGRVFSWGPSLFDGLPLSTEHLLVVGQWTRTSPWAPLQHNVAIVPQANVLSCCTSWFTGDLVLDTDNDSIISVKACYKRKVDLMRFSES